jgi:mRNA-degrading endonuclease RelE of RelBE toxin-antitoxin system
MKYSQTDSFEKDLKRLLKRFDSLNVDIKKAKTNAIELYHIEKIDNHSIFPIPGFCFDDVIVCKLKKFSCKVLKGRGNQSGIRIIYAFYSAELKVEFIEIYYKADQKIEDKSRIKAYLALILH